MGLLLQQAFQNVRVFLNKRGKSFIGMACFNAFLGLYF
jgi:hypothetical protein